MQKKIGNTLLGLGSISAAGVLIWGWKMGVLSSSRVGAAAGIGRMFFFLLYLPVPIILAMMGGILAHKEQVRKRWFLQKISLWASLLLILFVVVFVGFNLIHNVKYYGGGAVLHVLALNMGFVFPMLLLSGVLFYMGRLSVRN